MAHRMVGSTARCSATRAAATGVRRPASISTRPCGLVASRSDKGSASPLVFGSSGPVAAARGGGWPGQRVHLQRPTLQRCSATDPDKQASSWSVLPSRFNPAYVAIVGAYAALFALRNPYIFAALSIATIIPQNSTTTSLNSLVIFFYESGLFMNFAEAVYCVRLVTWLSILCCLLSFSVFS